MNKDTIKTFVIILISTAVSVGIIVAGLIGYQKIKEDEQLTAKSKLLNKKADNSDVNIEKKKKVDDSEVNIGKKNTEDIALLCNYDSRDGGAAANPKILIYSPANEVGKFGEILPDGKWNPEFRIDSKQSTIAEVEFSVTSYNMLLIKRINPDVKMAKESLKINRASLDTSYTFQGTDAISFHRYHFKCELLPDSEKNKHIKWVHDNTKRQESANKI